MHRVIGLDIGRSWVDVISDHQYMDEFPAVVGADYRELPDLVYGKGDIVLRYNGITYFGGELALRESEYPVQDLRATKLHERTKLLAVMAMHRAVEDGDTCFLVTGHPIGSHNAENKMKFRQMLQGDYRATLNGVTKSWNVTRCEVAAEGAVAVWGIKEPPKVLHVIDCGSRTTNYAVLTNKGLYDRLSGTIDMGCETVRNMQYGLFADAIYSKLSKRWLEQLGPVMIIGGKADHLYEEFKRYFKDVFTPPNPRLANALGMYEIGVKLNEQAATKR